MPPFIMMLAVAFVVIMVMFGNNPMDKWREEQAKYGKEPLAREINKFNEQNAKKADIGSNYKPPAGSTVYRLPQNEAQIQQRPLTNPDNPDGLVRPAPDVPISQWNSPYPNYMYAPAQGTGNPQTGTSIVPSGRTN